VSRETARSCTAVATLCLVACASGPHATASEPEPLSMALTTADGEPLELARLRGRPVLLFVFTTFDEACQLALIPLSHFAEAHPELDVVGVAAQPDPAQLLQLYADTLDVRFPLAYDPEHRVVSGRSPIGRVDTIPAYVVLDARGRVVARRGGAASEPELEALTEDVIP